MLLANKYVAKHVSDNGVQNLNRVHEAPEQTKVKDLKTFFSLLGYTISIDSPKAISKSINNVIQKVEGKNIENMVHYYAIRAMNKARYDPQNLGHYGLGFDYYSHFTSPIRRYSDIITHRSLQATLIKPFRKPTAELKAIAHQCNEKEINATRAERDSQMLYIMKFLETRKKQALQGTIKSMNDFCIFLEIDSFYCEGVLRYSDIVHDHFVFDARKFRAKSFNSGKTIHIGDTIPIEVKRFDYERLKVYLVSP